jgi:hypothetical protein
MASSLNLASVLASKTHQKRVTVIRPVSAPLLVKVKVKFKSGTPSRSTWCGPEWPLKGVKQVCNNLGAWAQTWASSLGLNKSPKESDRDSAGFGTLSPLYLALGLNLGLAYRLQ